jgi:hypothetical protein
MSTFIISTTDHTMPSDGIERILDNKYMVICILASHIKPIRIESEDRLIRYVFNGKETEEIEAKLLSGETILIDFQAIIIALESWNNAVTLNKSKARERLG